MINFTRAFDSAWERMNVILFRPFDPARWFIIGFNGFLVLLAEGGVAINNPFPLQGQNQTYQANFQSLPALLHGFKELLSVVKSISVSPWLALYIGIGLVYLVIWLVLNWVGCRGEFIFIDNIVRNRAAVSLPWQRYAHQGNMWFLAHLGLTLVSCVFYLTSAAVFLALNWTWINAERDPAGNEVTLLIFFLLLVFVVSMVCTAITFLIRSFVIPLYFKQTMGLGAAFLGVVQMTTARPVSILLYLLISLFLAFASGLLTILIFCLVCCCVIWLACIPFLGSLLLSFVLCQVILPILIFCRCFQLDCLAQFGPEYDVWTVDVAPTGPVVGLPSNLPPPLG